MWFCVGMCLDFLQNEKKKQKHNSDKLNSVQPNTIDALPFVRSILGGHLGGRRGG